MKILLSATAATLIAAAAAMPTPAAAQANERVLIVFGNDPCPTSNAGDEIVVCARKPEGERYRIPEEFRERTPSPDDTSWSERASSIEYVGRTGTQSCSTVGPGGWTGCYEQMLRNAREERRQAARDGSPQPPE
jgi:hypothetical protein